MFVANEYELLDFGQGRKLERFGPILLNRPSPAADGIKPAWPKLWIDATARFEKYGDKISRGKQSNIQRGRWIITGQIPIPWIIRHNGIQFEIELTPFGHVGVFPEQAENWDWIAIQSQAAPPRVLNLFAYTGGSTLSAAVAGAEVTHVDAARNIVTWARHNAELSGLSSAPIRWIADDALKFAHRELKRGRQYDALILDPPSFGHGPSGKAWRLDDNLPELLAICRELTGPHPRFVLLTCHAPNYDANHLADCLITAGFARRPKEIDCGELSLSTSTGRRLNAGHFARVSSL
jgi:23S rRNA (cytosine1962-C5)-methyltransferase